MDLLKAQFERISKQLAGLTASQRMLTVSLVAIMVITLVWWGKYAGEAEMQPLLNQSFAAEDLARITNDLDARGVHYTVAVDRVLVPSEKRSELIAALTYSHILPRNMKIGFDEMIGKITPFGSESTNEQIFNRAKEITLGQIIQDLPNVEHAEVMISDRHEHRIEGSIEPSASVTITMQQRQSPSPQLVDAAADIVQGAQSGLARNNIKVIVGGIARHVHSEQADDDLGGDGNDQLELVQKNEVRLANKLRETLSYIPELKVAVTVKLNTTSSSQKSTTYDAKGVISKEDEIQSESDNAETPGSTSTGEAGAAPNLGLAIPSEGGAGGSTTTREKNSSKIHNYVPETDTVSKTPAGNVTVVGATVRVPTSFFENIYSRYNPAAAGAAAPTEAQLRPYVDAEMPKIVSTVMKCTGLQSKDDVSVETYPDALPFAIASAPATASSVSMLVSGHGKELVLGGLAVMSLFMVSMLVRKGIPAVTAPVVVSSSPATAVTTLDSGEIIAGEAGSSAATLDGRELDDDEVRSQQMLDQVSTMVKENPDAAATLVKRWMNRA